jgi:hypothetical protein
MASCEAWSSLIVRAADGLLDGDSSRLLTDHLASCEPCRLEARAQLHVKIALGGRPEAAAPAHLALRISTALDAEASSRWIDLANWRTWGLRLLPAAAVLLAVALFAEQRNDQASQPVDLSTAVAAWGTPEGGVTELLTGDAAEQDSRLLSLVTGQPDATEEQDR